MSNVHYILKQTNSISLHKDQCWVAHACMTSPQEMLLLGHGKTNTPAIEKDISEYGLQTAILCTEPKHYGNGNFGSCIYADVYTNTHHQLLLLVSFNFLFVHMEEFDVSVVPDRGVVVPVDMVNNTNT